MEEVLKPIKIGFSPCPNDTFMFDALVHNRIDTGNLQFEPVMADVEELNRMAFAGELDVTKLSYHAFAHLTGTYQLLNAGSALGRNCGPLLIAMQPFEADAINDLRIAIPGKYTTANFLLSLAYPAAQNKIEMLFSDIEQAVLDGRVDAGLIIHENRFTYQDKGLVKLIDLGEFWEGTTGHPIPLGGIVVNRALPESTRQQIDRLVAQSVRYAFEHPEASLPYVKDHAQEMDAAVMRQHIELYVNEFSEDLGEVGRAAVKRLFEMAQEKGIIGPVGDDVLVPQNQIQS